MRASSGTTRRWSRPCPTSCASGGRGLSRGCATAPSAASRTTPPACIWAHIRGPVLLDHQPRRVQSPPRCLREESGAEPRRHHGDARVRRAEHADTPCRECCAAPAPEALRRPTALPPGPDTTVRVPGEPRPGSQCRVRSREVYVATADRTVAEALAHVNHVLVEAVPGNLVASGNRSTVRQVPRSVGALDDRPGHVPCRSAASRPAAGRRGTGREDPPGTDPVT
ncbi:DUF6182 family protein [Streptomyces sp. NPDC001410]|uniref:DUF6182 family protein n=1 Tax=Streptomyces sp. NPDC001410 TaxID=3364574 RepID=UPI0036C0262B